MSSRSGGSETETIWHPILRTCREEIAETCGDPRHGDIAEGTDRQQLVTWVEGAPEAVVTQIAARAGDFIMEGGDYWDALVLAAERLHEARQPR